MKRVAGDVDFQHAAKGLFAQVEQCGVVVDARSADHRVDTGLRVQRGDHRSAIAYVQRGAVHRQALPVPQIRHGRLQSLTVAVHGDHLEAVAREALHAGKANALRGTRHKGDRPLRAEGAIGVDLTHQIHPV